MANRRAPYDFNYVKKLTPQTPDMPRMNKRELLHTFVFIAPNPRTGRKYERAVEARVYASRNYQTLYCVLWARSRDGETRTRGYGSASGGGYCKVSAAIDSAAACAGFVMERNFNGCGERAAEIALSAIAKRLGWKTGELMVFSS